MVILIMPTVLVTAWARKQNKSRNAARDYAASREAVATPVRLAFEHQVDALVASLDTLKGAVVAERVLPDAETRAAAKIALSRARVAFKRTECLLEFYSPSTTSLLNGPPPDDDDDTPPHPLGQLAALQRIAESVAQFQAGNSSRAPTDSAAHDAESARKAVADFRARTHLLKIENADLLDAERLEIARVATVGLMGVDTDDEQQMIMDAASAFAGMRELMRASQSDADKSTDVLWTTAMHWLEKAEEQLKRVTSDASLNRLSFITAFANPASHAVALARSADGASFASLRRAWRPTAASVFDSNAFDASAYSQEYSPPATNASARDTLRLRIELGEQLFSDTRLSGPGTRSCATCHVQSLAFTDGRQRSITYAAGPKTVTNAVRNVPTLLNAALQPTLFADLRARSLEQQIEFVLTSATEMQSSSALVASRLAADVNYQVKFEHSFGPKVDSATSARWVRVALAEYVRSLVAMNSRFDVALRGDTNALNASERRGFEVFAGKGKCATCHFLPLTNGTAAPNFSNSEPEIVGTPSHTSRTGRNSAMVDADRGVASFDHLSQHEYAFKVPTLRNVELTAPYMHNGVFQTLEEVVDFYNNGGGVGIGITLPQQTLAVDSLHLTKEEGRDLVAFMKSLTDSTMNRRSVGKTN